ncbi:MAG: hypothetical protein J6B90_06485 [Lachnospiraceae bacterium]|nr:hypothetical protein [Lachnospiraceae bacterium]
MAISKRRTVLRLLEIILMWYAVHMQFLVTVEHGRAIVETGVVILLLLVSAYVEQKGWTENYKGRFLPAFFAICLMLGDSYIRTQSGGNWMGTGNPFKMCCIFLGLTLLIRKGIVLFTTGYEKVTQFNYENAIIKKLKQHCFRNVFILLLVVWLPIIILSYPGNLWADANWQLRQGLGIDTLYGHHPLASTLMMSGIVKIFYFLTGTYDVGLFVYVCVQAVLLAAALAGTIAWLNKNGSSNGMLLTVLLIYILSPMYSNAVSTAMKDVPYIAFVIMYIIMLAELSHNKGKLSSWKFGIAMVLIELLLSLFRHNGICIVVLAGMAALVVWWKSITGKQKIQLIIYLILAPAILLKLTNGAMASAFSAQTMGSKGEILSLPFQQTARYLTLYEEELTEEERAVYDTVLKDVDLVVESYNPDTADPVKLLYQDVLWKDLFAYAECYVKGFFRHPGVYFDAFFAHIYGWFDPGASNAIRYTGELEVFETTELFEGSDELLVKAYEKADEFFLFSILQNVGIYTWALFVLAGRVLRLNFKKIVVLIPLGVCLLICMVSPCFYNHPRYAWPIMFTIPFLYGVMALSKKSENK